MRPIWNGTISFGLVNIPVSVYPAVKSSEKVSFNLLHKEDMGRINNIRVCQKCEKKLAYTELVKGYQYEKDEYVVVTDKDFEKVSVESSKNIAILDFVEEDEIDPMFFDKPYFLVPGKNASSVYVLLRETLKRTKKVGIAKLALREREHLAIIKPHGKALMLDTMHFAGELNSVDDLAIPETGEKVGQRELEMAEKLVSMMTESFDPTKYKDTYTEGLLDIIDKKVKGVDVKTKPKKRQPTTNVVDIMSKLKESIEKTGPRKKSTGRKKRTAA
jgi:DNA end-binding protein Ku